MTTTTRELTVDRETVRKATRLLFERGEVIEVRALGVRRYDRDRIHTESGYFDNSEAALNAIEEISCHARGMYWSLNPIDSALLARRANRLDLVANGETTSDEHTTHRRYLPIDVDAIHPSGISATNYEHDAAIDCARIIAEALGSSGWPEPLVIDSGNGGWLLYRIDLPKDDGGLVQRCLEALAARFNTDGVEIDTGNYNPSRIAKIPGTPVRKGDDTPERPHRLASILSAPDRLEVVPRDLLETLAAEAPVKPEPERRTPFRGHRLDLRRFLDDAGTQIRSEVPWKGGTLYRLESCPVCGSNGGNARAIQFEDGALSAGCFESDCGFDWRWLRENHEDAYRAQVFVSSNGRHPDERRVLDEDEEDAPKTLTFHRGDEDTDDEGPSVDWVVPNWAASESITELSAKVKVGKTRLLLEMCREVTRGGVFLGQQVAPGGVLYLTEEGRSTFRTAMRRAGLTGDASFHYLLRQEAMGLGWPEIMDRVAAHAHEINARLMVIDTLSNWAQLGGDDENSAGRALEAMRPVRTAATSGLAVVIGRHDRKSGGEVGDSGRGSGAISGECDVLYQLSRSNTPGHETRRVLTGISRFDDIPGEMILELQEGRYVSLGDATALEREQAKAFVLDTLPDSKELGMTEGEIIADAGERFSRSTVRRALGETCGEGLVSKHMGFGTNGRAYGYWRTRKDVSNKELDPEQSILDSASEKNAAGNEMSRVRPPEQSITDSDGEKDVSSPPSLIEQSISNSDDGDVWEVA